MGQLHHGLKSRLEKPTQTFLVRIGQADDGKSEKKAKDDHGQDLSLSHGPEYIIRHHIQQQPLKGGFGTVAELSYGMGQLFRRSLQRQLRPLAWTYGIDQYQASDNGQQAGAQVIGKGLSTQAAKMTDLAYADHPGNNGGDDQGNDDHLKALEEKGSQKGKVKNGFTQQHSTYCAEEQRDEDLHMERAHVHSLPGFCSILWPNM